MALSIYAVTLSGTDETGRFQMVTRVAALNEQEAVVLARGSAALKGNDGLDDQGAVIDDTAPKVLDDLRRVLGHSDKDYTI